MEFLEILKHFAESSNMSDSEFSMLQNELQKTEVGRAYIAMNSEAARMGIITNPNALVTYAMECFGCETAEGIFKGIHALGFALCNGLSGEMKDNACYALANAFTKPLLTDLIKSWSTHLAYFFKINIFEKVTIS
jgi:hypothetical protein